jgi:hypothetical protein
LPYKDFLQQLLVDIMYFTDWLEIPSPFLGFSPVTVAVKSVFVELYRCGFCSKVFDFGDTDCGRTLIVTSFDAVL